MLYTLLNQNPAVYLFTSNKNNPLDVLREDYSYIKENGYDGVDLDHLLPFNPVDATQLFKDIEDYMTENHLISIPVMAIGPHAKSFNYSKPKIWYADELAIQYPTYGTIDDIRKFSNTNPDTFKLALESAMDLSFKNYQDGTMGPLNSTLCEFKDPKEVSTEDVLGYILIPVKVKKTPILSFSETREETTNTAAGS